MSTPIFDPDDPRLTAYALGELPDAAERQAVEALLSASPEARAAVEETRALSGRLEAEFAHENAAYQRANPPTPLVTNVIPFPSTSRGWRPVVVQTLKIAAVFLVLGALAMAVTRRRPPAVVASLPSAAPKVMPEAPAPAAPVAPAPSAEAPAPAQGDVAAVGSAVQGSAVEAEPPPSDLAMDRAAQASARRARVADAAPGAARPAPAAAAAAAAAAPMMQPPAASLEERLAAATVRVRLDDGTYVGGVVLTADGWIMAARQLPTTKKPRRATVVLADGREFVVTATMQNMGRDLFRIKAASLPTVKLAATAPNAGSQLLVAHANERGGNTAFQRVPVGQTDAGTLNAADFVFNTAGELLATAEPPSMAKADARAMAAPARDKVPALAVRPFTASERAALTHPPR